MQISITALFVLVIFVLLVFILVGTFIMKNTKKRPKVRRH